MPGFHRIYQMTCVVFPYIHIATTHAGRLYLLLYLPPNLKTRLHSGAGIVCCLLLFRWKRECKSTSRQTARCVYVGWLLNWAGGGGAGLDGYYIHSTYASMNLIVIVIVIVAPEYIHTYTPLL